MIKKMRKNIIQNYTRLGVILLARNPRLGSALGSGAGLAVEREPTKKRLRCPEAKG